MQSNKVRMNERAHTVAPQTVFVLEKKYHDLKPIGKGSYGVVCSAKGNGGHKVAIKKVTPMCKRIDDSRHVLRELRLMRHMGKHQNIISLEDIYIRPGADELYIVMELLDSDLHKIIQSKQQLTDVHFRYFFHQLLCGVNYLHQNRIIHRDLKPGNLLVSRDCRLRITDFGLARQRPLGKGASGGYPEDEVDEPMTEHVVTRWYRAAELMLLPDGLYSYSVDMWACGCILAEMIGRKALFPGKNFVHQLTLIFDIIGSPQDSEVAHIKNSQARKFLDAQKGKRKVPFEELYPSASRDAIDMLDTLLVFDPDRRVSAEQALSLPYMNKAGATKDPLSSVYPPTGPDFEFDFERSDISNNDLKDIIVHEQMSFRSEQIEAGGPAPALDLSSRSTSKRSTGGGGNNSVKGFVDGEGIMSQHSRQSSLGRTLAQKSVLSGKSMKSLQNTSSRNLGNNSSNRSIGSNARAASKPGRTVGAVVSKEKGQGKATKGNSEGDLPADDSDVGASRNQSSGTSGMRPQQNQTPSNNFTHSIASSNNAQCGDGVSGDRKETSSARAAGRKNSCPEATTRSSSAPKGNSNYGALNFTSDSATTIMHENDTSAESDNDSKSHRSISSATTVANHCLRRELCEKSQAILSDQASKSSEKMIKGGTTTQVSCGEGHDGSDEAQGHDASMCPVTDSASKRSDFTEKHPSESPCPSTKARESRLHAALRMQHVYEISNSSGADADLQSHMAGSVLEPPNADLFNIDNPYVRMQLFAKAVSDLSDGSGDGDRGCGGEREREGGPCARGDGVVRQDASRDVKA